MPDPAARIARKYIRYDRKTGLVMFGKRRDGCQHAIKGAAEDAHEFRVLLVRAMKEYADGRKADSPN